MVVRFSPNPDPMFVLLQEVRDSGHYTRGSVMVAFATQAGVRHDPVIQVLSINAHTCWQS